MRGYFDLIQRTVEADGMPARLSCLIAAQGAHESRNFTSDVFREDLNSFGYKYVKGAKWQAGPGRMSPEGNRYAHYTSVENSAHEIASWIKRRIKEGRFPELDSIKTPLQYAKALKACSYFGDPTPVYAGGITRALTVYT